MDASLRGFPRKLARLIFRALGWSVLLLSTLFVLAFAALELPYGRDFVRRQVNQSVEPLFKGTLVIDRIGDIGIFSVSGVDAHLLDAKGNRVLSVHGLAAKSVWPRMLPSLARGNPLTVTIDRVSCDHVQAVLIDDGSGSPTLAEAFLPRSPDPSSEPSTTSIFMPAVRVKHAWAHGSLSSVPTIDVEVFDLSGSLAQRPEVLRAQLDHLGVRARSLPAQVDPTGTLKANLVLPAAQGSDPRVSASFEGTLWNAPSSISAQLREDRVEAKLRIAELKAETLRQHMPSLTLKSTTSLEAQLHGQLPSLHLEAQADNGALHLNLRGDATIGDTKTVKAKAELTRVNLAQIIDAPATNLELRLSTALEQSQSGGTHGSFRIAVPQGEAAGRVTPQVQTAGTLRFADAGTLHIAGDLSIHEPGAYAQLEYALDSRPGNEQVAQGKLSVQFTRPPRAQRELGLTASGALQAEARLDIARRQLESTVLLDVHPLLSGSLSVQSLRVRAVASGPMQSPTFSVDSSGHDIVLGARRLSRVVASAAGDTRSFTLQAQVEEDQQRRVGLTTMLTLGNMTEFVEPRVTLATAGGTDIQVQAQRVAYDSGTVRFDRLRLTGAGELTADGSLGEKNTRLEFTTSRLQVARILRSLGFPIEVQQATLSSQGNVSGPLRKLSGRVEGNIADLEFDRIRGGKIALDVSVRNNTATGSITAELGRSQLTARLDEFDLPTRSVSRRDLFDLRGKAELTGRLDLARLEPLMNRLGLPVQQASGVLRMTLDLENLRNGPAAPKLAVSLKTHALRIIEQRRQPNNIETKEAALGAQPLSVEGLDLDTSLMVSAAAREARLQASVSDEVGPLAYADLQTELPDLTDVASLAAFNRSRASMRFIVPERAVDDLPRFLRPRGIKGYVRADARFEGSVQDPKLDATIAVRRFKYLPRARAIRATANLHYERDSGELQVVARSGGRRVADLSSQWTGSLLAKLRNAESYVGFSLDTDLKLDEFPAGAIPTLADHSVRGVVSCDLRLRDFGRDADLQMTIDGSKLSIRDQRIAELAVFLEATERSGIRARLHAEQHPGSMSVDFEAPLQWGSRLTPVIGASARAALKAAEFQIEPLSPLLLPTVTELEGILDASLDFQLAQGLPRLAGKARLQRAAMVIPQIGQRFSDVNAQLSINGPEIVLDSLEARGTSGQLTASGRARLEGAELRSASARLNIDGKDKLPITFEGVEIGDAWGQIDVSYELARQGADIRVNVPRFQIEIPEESIANVQSLEPDEHVHIGTFSSGGRFAAIPLQPLTGSEDSTTAEQKPPTRLHVHLGNSVWVEKAQQARVQLMGDLTVILGEPTQIDGRIDLRGGTLDVNGKTFHIESGTVAFTGADSTNPTITATARWDSPTGYTVYAQFSGTVENGRLTLRAEPSLTQNQIVSLLLFGSPEGSLGARPGGGGTAATAVGVAGGAATKGLNRMINDFTQLDVSARIDTSTGSARPELVMQVTPRLTTRVTRALGQPAPGQSPDRTFLTVELRLQRAWALSAVVGDRGASALDLIWRHRY